MLTNLFLRCVPQAGTPIERAGHLQVSMALLGNAFELPCPLALLPCELAAGQDLLRLLQCGCGYSVPEGLSCHVCDAYVRVIRYSKTLSVGNQPLETQHWI